MKNISTLFKHIIGLGFTLMLIVQAISIEVRSQSSFLSQNPSDIIPAETREKIVNGYPQLNINGNTVVPVMSFVNTNLGQR